MNVEIENRVDFKYFGSQVSMKFLQCCSSCSDFSKLELRKNLLTNTHYEAFLFISFWNRMTEIGCQKKKKMVFWHVTLDKTRDLRGIKWRWGRSFIRQSSLLLKNLSVFSAASLVNLIWNWSFASTPGPSISQAQNL